MATKKKTEVETAAVEETVKAVAEETAVEEMAETVAEEAAETTAEEAAVKAQVKTKFRDKYTGKLYKPGDTIEVTEARLAEMNTGRVRVQKL